MKNAIKRMFVCFLSLALCWGSAAVVVYAWAPEDGAESPEQSDTDPENTEKSADGKESSAPIAEESGENSDDVNSGADAEHETTAGGENAEKTAGENIVRTAAELKQWCSDHRDSGGRVTLGGNIAITETISISGGNGHIVIDTGQFGLVYNGGCISLSRFEITGEGIDVPVLDIQTVIQYGYFWEPGWNDVVQNLNITATGSDGTGGVAVRVRQDDGYSAHYNAYSAEGLIRSYGTGAIGLYLDAPLEAYCFQIEVEGDDSATVYAPRGASLYYCKLTAEGAGASVVSGNGEILLDTCAASPEPQNARVVNYCIVGISGIRLYYPVGQNGGIDDLDSSITFLLSAGDGQPFVTQAFYINWEYDFVDTSVLGRITIQGRFDPPFQGLGLEDDFPLECIVDVRDPNIPCISHIIFIEDTDVGSYVYLDLWDTYDRDDENVILWRSDDGGKRWYDFSDSPDIEWTVEWFGSRIYYYYGEITGSVLLQLEVLGKGESNVVTLSSFDGSVFGDPGGDRDGGDRNIVSGSNNGNSTDAGYATEGGDSSGNGNISGSNNGTGSRNFAGDNHSSNGRNSTGAGYSSGKSSRNSTDGSSSTGEGSAENGNPTGRSNASGNGNGSNLNSAFGNEDTTGSDTSSGGGSQTDSDNGSGNKVDTPLPTQDSSTEQPSIQNDSGSVAVSADGILRTEAAPEEWESGNTIAISGRRLAAMIEANPEAVMFIKNGIQISIAPADLLALGLGENQLFMVEIKKLTGSSFSVFFKADDIELSGLPFVAYIGETVFDSVSLASAVCVDENGDALPLEYDPGTGKLSISMTGLGVFTLQTKQLAEAAAALVRDIRAVQEQEQGGQPAEPPSPLDAGMIVASICTVSLPAGVGVFVWCKRRLARR